MSNLRIYIVIATFHPQVGGAERQALLQGRSLRERGIAATIVTFHHDKTWLPSEMIEGIPVIRVAGLLLGHRENLPKVLQKLCYLIALVIMGWTLWRSRHQYDVLHVYQLNLLALPTALVCRFTGKPMIIAVRSTGLDKVVSSPNLFADKRSRKALLIAGTIDSTVPWLQVDRPTWHRGDLADLQRLGKSVVQFTCSLLQRNQSAVVVLSSRMKEYLAAYNFNVPDIHLIPNGVDSKRFNTTCIETSCDKGAQIVVCISRLGYEKGIDVLLQAWHLVHKHMQQARLIIVGDGPLQPQLVRMVEALSIADSVEFAGMQCDIPAQLHRGSLAVLPSRYEGMPNAVLEAMACGLACVATRVSGSEDIIQYGVNGLLVESEDYQGMAQALLTLLRDPSLAQKYGHAARATIEQHYSLEHITDTYVELYHKLVDHKLRKESERD